MRIVFWENIISQHKLPYWVKIADHSSVDTFTLIVEKELDEALIENGWYNDLKDLEKIKIVISPTTDEIKSLLLDKISDSYHVFSGIRSIPLVKKAFNISKAYPVHRILLTETVNVYGLRAITRRLASLFIERPNLKHYDLVLGSGYSAKSWYMECGLDESKFFPFQYVTRKPAMVHSNKNNSSIISFVYVGQMIHRKGVDILIRALSKLKYENWTLDLYGTGEDLNKYIALTNRLRLNEKVKFRGVEKNDSLIEKLAHFDCLILPSRFDGWGAVINEAFNAGLRVITNKRCGASILVVNDKLGQVISSNNVKNLKKAIEIVIDSDLKNHKSKEYIFEYANALSSQHVANYLVDIIKFGMKIKQTRPLPPWINFIKTYEKS